MTSMLLIDSAMADAGCAVAAARVTVSTTRLPFLGAIARRDLLFGSVLRGAVLDHLAHHRAIACHERRDRLEFLAVPLLELHHAGALVVEAARLHRREQSRGAELLQPRFGQVEMLEPVAHLVGCHHLALAELVLRNADGLDDHDPVRDTARVIDGADTRLVLEVALARAIHFLLDLL